jgi:hypothetical protein
MNTFAEIFASDVETVLFWLSPENAKALSQLREKQPELGAFVDKIKELIEIGLAKAQQAVVG